MKRQIVHVDMDAFYAAVEQRDNPSLQGKPVIVGGRSFERGVVSTCSYEARKFGVKSAMPLFQAKKLCPQAAFLPADLEKYKAVSQEIFSVYQQFTPIIEPISIDEAFLDVTGCTQLFGSAENIGAMIKSKIKSRVNLNASVGISHNKFLAKLASDIDKPDGFKVITEKEAEAFLAQLPIERLWGIGKKTAVKLNSRGIKFIGQLQKLSLEQLELYFGNSAETVFDLTRGIDHRPVNPQTKPKSIGNETTFDVDFTDKKQLIQILLKLSQKVGRRVRKSEVKGRTITLKLRYKDFQTITRNYTLEKATNLDSIIFDTAKELIENLEISQPVRLIGLTVSNLVDSQHEEQLTLFCEDKKSEKEEKLVEVLDRLKDKHGEKIITRGNFF